MRILHLNTVDSRGGASKMADRLHHELLSRGEHSDFYVRKKLSDDDTIKEIGDGGPRIAEHAVARHFIDTRRTAFTNSAFTFSCHDIDHEDLDFAAFPHDLFHLHWIERFLSLADLSRLVRHGKPIVWTVHDQKPATGGCHCSYECTEYQRECAPCSQLAEDPFHIPQRVLRAKREIFSHANLTLVAPSSWMAGVIGSSQAFPNAAVRTIPHGIQTDIFKNVDKGAAKKRLDIDPETTTLMFNAYNNDAHHKGFDLLLETLERSLLDQRFANLCSSGRILILQTGKPSKKIEQLRIPYVSFGYISDVEEMAGLYQATDILVNPSLVESFSLVSLEAMSCGAVVAGFRTGGMVDFIHDDCGALVEYRSVSALTDAVLRLVFQDSFRQKLSARASEVVKARYRIDIMTDSYVELYQELCEREGPGETVTHKEVDHFHDLIAHAMQKEARYFKECLQKTQNNLAQARNRLRAERERTNRLKGALYQLDAVNTIRNPLKKYRKLKAVMRIFSKQQRARRL